MKKAIGRALDWMIETLIELNYLVKFGSSSLAPGPHDLVVSMTSYPGRIKHAWLSIESLFRQNDNRFMLVLVLSAQEFPTRKLPMMLRLQQKKGLQVLWVEENNRSFDHLWPAYREFPDKSIISVDDDKHFPPTLTSILRYHAATRPGVIIGARGWRMRLYSGDIEFGPGWERAGPETPSAELFMPPGNGSLYPPGSLPELAGDTALMRKICPIADDVWFWAAARIHGTPSFCVGMPAHRPVRKQSQTPALSDYSPGPRDFARTIDHFGLRKDLLKDLVAQDEERA